MTISVEKFIEQTPAKRGRRRSSKIWQFADEILKLKELNYSYDQILTFLLNNGVEVKYSTLVSFVRRAEKLLEKAEAQSEARQLAEQGK